MAIDAGRRGAGWLLALGLNLLFYRLALAPPHAPHEAVAASRSQPVWIRPMVVYSPVAATVPARPPLRERGRDQERVRRPAPAVSVMAAAAVPAAARDSLPAPADPFTAPASAGSLSVSERAIRDGVRATLAEAGPAPPLAAMPGAYQAFAGQVEAASTPGCLGADALKHDPPKIPGTAIALKGLLVLPHLAHAALTGKCR